MPWDFLGGEIVYRILSLPHLPTKGDTGMSYCQYCLGYVDTKQEYTLVTGVNDHGNNYARIVHVECVERGDKNVSP